ncbi:MAG: ABC transporter substrate-binding protein [Alphaproteobacteria bacterium]|uniref:ABC transporter substrate-binding protein n=1 Tax=Candidatus Nitrobium versatile TaxID=2884831 RepID=A0A953SDB0_9BACT|nr:ABC transporter substrate-binding protein [Candidatus Nitrobium versatile]
MRGAPYDGTSAGRKTRLVLFFFVIQLCAVYCPVPLQAEQDSAAAVIRRFNAALLEAMKRAGELGYSGRFRLLEPVIKDSFAIPYMANVSIGRYGRTLDEKQKDAFLDLYTEWTIASYAGRFDGYSGERFEVEQESKSPRGTATVVSRMIQENGEVVAFHYRLRRIEGKWRIVDIQISGVSQLALTRSQFVNTIKNSGFDALVSQLKKKIKGYARGEEK